MGIKDWQMQKVVQQLKAVQDSDEDGSSQSPDDCMQFNTDDLEGAALTIALVKALHEIGGDCQHIKDTMSRMVVREVFGSTVSLKRSEIEPG